MLTDAMRSAPAAFFAESGAVRVLPEYISQEKVLVIAGITAWKRAGEKVRDLLENAACELEIRYVGRDCYWDLIKSLAGEAKKLGAAWILGVGGGKVMDLSKVVAEMAGKPVALVPTTSATCACWTSLSVIYDAEGKYAAVHELAGNPDLTVADYDIIATAPPRHLAAGALDALAKWYEVSSIVDEEGKKNPAILTGLAIARVCRDILYRYGPEAMTELVKGRVTEAVTKTIWANLVLPVLASGLVIERYKFGLPHAFYNNLSRIDNARRTSLHGEQVAYGLALTMLVMQPVHPELEEFLQLSRNLGMPLSLVNLGLQDKDLAQFREVITATISAEGIDKLPFSVTDKAVWQAIRELERREGTGGLDDDLKGISA